MIPRFIALAIMPAVHPTRFAAAGANVAIPRVE